MQQSEDIIAFGSVLSVLVFELSCVVQRTLRVMECGGIRCAET